MIKTKMTLNQVFFQHYDAKKKFLDSFVNKHSPHETKAEISSEPPGYLAW